LGGPTDSIFKTFLLLTHPGSRIKDTGVKKAPDPGSGSATLDAGTVTIPYYSIHIFTSLLLYKDTGSVSIRILKFFVLSDPDPSLFVRMRIQILPSTSKKTITGSGF
jgi:hypothetical protein